jgi:hypothetical protein
MSSREGSKSAPNMWAALAGTHLLRTTVIGCYRVISVQDHTSMTRSTTHTVCSLPGTSNVQSAEQSCAFNQHASPPPLFQLVALGSSHPKPSCTTAQHWPNQPSWHKTLPQPAKTIHHCCPHTASPTDGAAHGCHTVPSPPPVPPSSWLRSSRPINPALLLPLTGSTGLRARPHTASGTAPTCGSLRVLVPLLSRSPSSKTPADKAPG